jgi:dephospho-CoA kinase
MGHRRRSLRIGLTGSLASGKSTTLKFFKKQGWKVLSADEVVEEIYKENHLTKEMLRKECGKSPAKLKKLEKWIHPLVEKRIKGWMKKQKSPAIVEVPLLFEASFDKFFQKNIFVYAARADREKRVIKRGMSRKLFRILDSKQFPAIEKISRADFILHNLSKKSLKAQVKSLSKFLISSSKK